MYKYWVRGSGQIGKVHSYHKCFKICFCYFSCLIILKSYDNNILENYNESFDILAEADETLLDSLVNSRHVTVTFGGNNSEFWEILKW